MIDLFFYRLKKILFFLFNSMNDLKKYKSFEYYSIKEIFSDFDYAPRRCSVGTLFTII